MMTKRLCEWWTAGSAVLLIPVLVALTGCSKPQTEEEANLELEEGQIQNRTYHTDKIGWTMEIPEGWQVLTREESDGYTEKGQEMLEQSQGTEVEVEKLVDLLNLKRDRFHVFQSTIEPYDPAVDGDWAENNAGIRQLLIDTFTSQGIQVKASEIETVMIGGQEFQTYRFELARPNGEKFLEQIMYSRLINGYDFGANISYQEEKYGNELIDAFLASKFETP